MALVDYVMDAHGVSDFRMASFLGWGKYSLRDMRERRAYRQVEKFRLLLWALGLELTVRKVGEPFCELLITEKQVARKRAKTYRRTRLERRWSKGKLWVMADAEAEAIEAKEKIEKFFEEEFKDEQDAGKMGRDGKKVRRYKRKRRKRSKRGGDEAVAGGGGGDGEVGGDGKGV